MTLNSIFSLLFATEKGRHIGLAFIGISVLSSIIIFNSMILTWWSDAHLSSNVRISSAPASEVISPDKLLASIPQAHLFGSSLTLSSHIPITSLQILLTGIIKMEYGAESKQSSKAIISVEGGIGKIYQVGHILPNGIKVSAITSDGVIVDNDGHLEKLPLHRARLEKK